MSKTFTVQSSATSSGSHAIAPVLLDNARGDHVRSREVGLEAKTFAVALFKMPGETAKDPLFKEICRYILQDESRHMGFGMLRAPDGRRPSVLSVR